QARGGVRAMIVLMAFLSIAACGVTSSTGGGAQPIATATSSAPSAAFAVTTVDLTVNPNSIAGKTCGSSASFTYTATFHVPAYTAGGTIQFMYTTTNGRRSTSEHVTVPAGATTATYMFTTSGPLPTDHTFPGVAEVMVTSPGNAHSPQVTVAGSCTTSAAVKVTSIDMA